MIAKWNKDMQKLSNLAIWAFKALSLFMGVGSDAI